MLPPQPRLLQYHGSQGLLREKAHIPENGKVLSVRIDGGKLLLFVAVVVVIIGGVALRAHTLSDSRYPYILDGLREASYGGNIAKTGILTPEAGSSFNNSHTASTPAFDIFIATASLFQGESSLFLIQKLIAPFAILMLIGVYVLAKKLTTNVRASLITLMATSAYGPFVIVTQASWKECISISLMPFIFMSFIMRRDPKMRAISTLLLLMIPFVHHFIALMVILAIASFSSASMMMARKAGRVDSVVRLDVLVSAMAIISMTIYYIFMKFDRLEYLTPESGLYLFLGLAVLITVGVYFIAERGMSKFGRKAMVTVMAGGLILLLVLNFLSPVGTIGSNALWAISLPMLAGIAIAVLGILGMSLWAATVGESKLFYFSMISAPFIIITYALLRADDLLSFDMITRTIDLFDIGLMIGVGTFVIFILRKKTFIRTTATLSIVCVAFLLTVPFALDSETYAGVRNDIYAYEIDAINWTVGMTLNHGIDTDEHFAYVGVIYNREMGQSLVKQFKGVIDFQSGSTVIASERWVTIGVKDMPYGWVKLDSPSFEAKLSSFNVLYLGGPPGTQIVVLTITAGS